MCATQALLPNPAHGRPSTLQYQPPQLYFDRGENSKQTRKAAQEKKRREEEEKRAARKSRQAGAAKVGWVPCSLLGFLEDRLVSCCGVQQNTSRSGYRSLLQERDNDSPDRALLAAAAERRLQGGGSGGQGRAEQLFDAIRVSGAACAVPRRCQRLVRAECATCRALQGHPQLLCLMVSMSPGHCHAGDGGAGRGRRV